MPSALRDHSIGHNPTLSTEWTGSTSYVGIASLVEIHISEKATKQTTKDTLRWVHIFIVMQKGIC